MLNHLMMVIIRIMKFIINNFFLFVIIYFFWWYKMDKDERLVLGILVNTNKTLFEAKKSNKHRLNSFGDINKDRYDLLEKISVNSLEQPLKDLRNEIINVLNF